MITAASAHAARLARREEIADGTMAFHFGTLQISSSEPARRASGVAQPDL